MHSVPLPPGVPARVRSCDGMRGILDEVLQHAAEPYDDDSLGDAAIIGGLQRVEHYEIAAYGTAAAHAGLLGHDSVAELLEASLVEEKAADKRLTEVAETVINLDALDEGAEVEDMKSPMASESDHTQHAKGGRSR